MAQELGLRPINVPYRTFEHRLAQNICPRPFARVTPNDQEGSKDAVKLRGAMHRLAEQNAHSFAKVREIPSEIEPVGRW